MSPRERQNLYQQRVNHTVRKNAEIMRFRSKLASQLADAKRKHASRMKRLKAECAAKVLRVTIAIQKRCASEVQDLEHQHFMQHLRKQGVPILPAETNRWANEEKQHATVQATG